MSTTWVALLRGVNVNGRTVRSAELAEVFRGLDLDEVKTFLASGNVRFDADAGIRSRGSLKRTIEESLADRFGYDAWIVLITLDELRAAIDGFPFDPDDAKRQPYVIFGSDDAPLRELADAAAEFEPDVDPVRAGKGVVYWNPVKGTTVDTPFGKLLAKARFAPATTNRNLRTLHKIAG